QPGEAGDVEGQRQDDRPARGLAAAPVRVGLKIAMLRPAAAEQRGHRAEVGDEVSGRQQEDDSRNPQQRLIREDVAAHRQRIPMRRSLGWIARAAAMANLLSSYSSNARGGEWMPLALKGHRG